MKKFFSPVLVCLLTLTLVSPSHGDEGRESIEYKVKSKAVETPSGSGPVSNESQRKRFIIEIDENGKAVFVGSGGNYGQFDLERILKPLGFKGPVSMEFNSSGEVLSFKASMRGEETAGVCVSAETHAKIIDKLALDESQKESARLIFDSLREESLRLGDVIRASEADLKGAIQKKTIDFEEIRVMLERIGSATVQARFAGIKAVERLRSILDAEQKKLLQDALPGLLDCR